MPALGQHRADARQLLARQAFERVVESYPDDDMASLAKQALGRFNQ